MDQSWVDLLHFIPGSHAAILAGVDPLLLDPEESSKAETQLRGFLEHLAGRRSFESLITRALEEGPREEALRLAARAAGAGAQLPAALGTRLDELYGRLREEHQQRLTATLEQLNKLNSEAPQAAAMAEEQRVALHRLFVPETRPTSAEAYEEVRAALRELSRVQAEVKELSVLAHEEASERRAALFHAARNAAKRSLDLLERASSMEGLEADLLRLLPNLVLGRRSDLLEAIAAKERPLEDASLQAELSAFAAVAAPSTRSFTRVAPPPPPPTTGKAAVQLSVISDLVFRPIRASIKGLSGPEELRRLAGRSHRVRTDKESSLLWLSLAKATEDTALRQAALGYGLFYEGRSLLAQSQYRFATEVLRDSLQCLFDASRYVEDDAQEQAAFALVATRAWPRRLASRSSRDAELQVLTWLDQPQQMFTWLRDTGHALLIANLAADIPRVDVAEAFLGLTRSYLGSEQELLRAYVDAILKPQRLLAEPELTMEKLSRLLAPAEPTARLQGVLDEVARLLEAIGKRPPSPSLRAGILKQVEVLREELDQLKRHPSVPVEEVLELLPSLLLSRVETGEIRNTPHLTFQPLVQCLRPAERSEEVLLPVMVRNIGAMASDDLSLQLSVVEDGKEESGIVFYEGGRQAEHPVGGLDPDTSQQVNFIINMPEDLAERRTECRFRAVLVSQRETLLDETFSVALRPDDYGRRKSPYTTGEVVTGEHFIGRDRELKQIRDALVGGTQERTPLVVGIRRIGKTSILKQTLLDPEVLRHYYPVYVDVEDRPASETTSTFLIYLCEKILEGIPAASRTEVVFHRKDFDVEPYNAFERFTQSLSALKMKKRLLLVIDEFDWLFKLAAKTQERQEYQDAPLKPNEAFQPEVFGAIRKALLHCRMLRMLFAGLPVLLQRSSYEARLFGLLDPVRVDRFTEQEAQEVLNAAKNSFNVPPVSRELLFRSTGLQPYMLQVVCHYLFARMIDSGRDVVTPLDISEVIETEILANESYFTDYVALIGKDVQLLHALALAVRELSPTREFVSAKDVQQQLALLGEDMTVEEVETQLVSLCQSDRPLVRSAPNNSKRFRLVIGMVGDWLIRRSSQ